MGLILKEHTSIFLIRHVVFLGSEDHFFYLVNIWIMKLELMQTKEN